MCHVLKARNVVTRRSTDANRSLHLEKEKNHTESINNHNINVVVSSLKECAMHRDLSKGIRIHDDVLMLGLFQRSPIVGNSLINMYAKCGAFSKAGQVLNEMSVRNIGSWNALISAYAQQGYGDNAFKCYEQMQVEGIFPDVITFTSILKACGIRRRLQEGERIHKELVEKGLLAKDAVLNTALVDMYAKCGALPKAVKVLSEFPVHDAVCWNALLSGYVDHGLGQDALRCFEQMQRWCISPDAVTLVSVTKACGITKAIEKGKEIHDEAVRRDMLKKSVVLGAAIVDMYVKCGALPKAQEVLSKLPVKNVFSWNALIHGYAEHGQHGETLFCFECMQREDISPDVITFTCLLKACGSIRAIDKGKFIHEAILKKGFLKNDIELGNSLVDMYAKCGNISIAEEVLFGLPIQNIVSWNSLMSGYCQHGQVEEALDCFARIQNKGLCPNAITFTCVVTACGCMGKIQKGERIHNEIVCRGLLEKDVILGTALVHMYVRCGMFWEAEIVLNELPIRDVVTWSVLISGYADLGLGVEAINCFAQMQRVGFPPNAFTFVSLLNACSHSGLVDESLSCYFNMNANYGVIPDIEHHTCIIDLLGRAGLMDEAITMINNMPSLDNCPVWGSLLGACQKWRNPKFGRLAFDQAVQLDGNNIAAYACMDNIYTIANLHE